MFKAAESVVHDFRGVSTAHGGGRGGLWAWVYGLRFPKT